MARAAPGDNEQGLMARMMVLCGWRGIAVYRRNVMGTFPVVRNARTYWVKVGEKGQSDVWGILPGGRHFELEVKRPGERPTPEQLNWLDEVNRRGGVALWCDDVGQLAHWLDLILDLGMRPRVEPDGTIDFDGGQK